MSDLRVPIKPISESDTAEILQRSGYNPKEADTEAAEIHNEAQDISTGYADGEIDNEDLRE